MVIETKFNHGQRVQGIVQGQESYIEKCPVCEGNGYFLYKDRKIDCSESGCWGEGYITKYKNSNWHIPKNDGWGWSNFVIQKIGVELYNPNNKKVSDNRSWIYYMAGNSGSMWNENDLFASVEEAQAECDKRNKNEK